MNTNDRNRPTLQLNGLTPPHSEQMERALLGAIITEGGAGTMPRALDEGFCIDWFYLPKHQVIASAILELHGDRMPIDEALLFSTLEMNGKLAQAGGAAAVLDVCSSVDSAAHLPHYITTVRAGYQLRQLIRASRAAIEQVYAGFDDDLEIFWESQKRAFADVFALAGAGADLMDSASLAQATLEAIREGMDHPQAVRGVPTGLLAVDDITMGVQEEDFYIIGGATSMGKTIRALNLLSAGCRDGASGLYFSLEMPAGRLMRRVYSTQSGISHRRLNRGEIDPRSDLPYLRQAEKAVSAWDFKVWDGSRHRTGKLTADELVAKTTRWRQERKHKRCFIVVDNIQLLVSSDRRKNRYEHVVECGRDLKRLAKALKIGVVGLAQFNREIQREARREPRVSDIGEGPIENDADVVELLGLHPDDITDETYDDDLVACPRRGHYLRKVRSGPRCWQPSILDKGLQFFKDVPKQAPSADAPIQQEAALF